ncbi:MAG: hypothetical protein NVS9B14_17930 [Candidatus Acidiferrum sp.]
MLKDSGWFSCMCDNGHAGWRGGCIKNGRAVMGAGVGPSPEGKPVTTETAMTLRVWMFVCGSVCVVGEREGGDGGGGKDRCRSRCKRKLR